MRRKILGASMLTAIGVVIISGILFNMQVTEPLVEKQVQQEQGKWELWPLGDASVVSGDTGFMYGMYYPHQGDPGTAYASNLSNASAYEYSDSLNASMTGETPYNTAFDIVFKFQVGGDEGYNTSASAWVDEWVRAYLNETISLSISAEAMTEVVIGTDGSSNRWYHYYLNNSGSGYTLSKGEKTNMSINFEVYG